MNQDFSSRSGALARLSEGDGYLEVCLLFELRVSFVCLFKVSDRVGRGGSGNYVHVSEL